jgi:hypothetical protein
MSAPEEPFIKTPVHANEVFAGCFFTLTVWSTPNRFLSIG